MAGWRKGANITCYRLWAEAENWRCKTGCFALHSTWMIPVGVAAATKTMGSCKLNKWFTMSFGEWVVLEILCIRYLVYIFIFSMILRCCVCSCSSTLGRQNRTLAFDLPGSIWPTCFQSADDWFDSNWGSRTCPQLKCLKIDPTMCWFILGNKTEHEN